MQLAGVYANFANVSFSDYEFTITFARIDHEVEDGEVPGVVVSRVNMSHAFMRELIEAMQDSWSKWSTREGIKNLPRSPSEPVGPGMRVAVHLGHPREPACARGRARGDRRARRPTRSGASATSSATGRGRTSAARSSRARADVCLVGNHDLAVARAARPRRASRRTRPRPRAGRDEQLDRRDPRATSSRSSPTSERDGRALFHASPRDPVWEYVLTQRGRASPRSS